MKVIRHSYCLIDRRTLKQLPIDTSTYLRSCLNYVHTTGRPWKGKDGDYAQLTSPNTILVCTAQHVEL